MKLIKHLTFTQLCVALLLLLCIALAGSLTSMELRAEEPRRALVAMEMVMRNEWIVPKIHDAEYYNKPPLFNWLMAAVFTLTGSFGEVAVRLPSLLAFLFAAFLVFKITGTYTSKKTGVIAAFLLLCSADILFYGSVNTGEIDLFFMLLVFLQAIAIFHYSQKEQWLHMFVLSYIFTSAGVLTKFLPALLFQAVALAVWLAYTRQFRRLFSWQHFAGIVCCALLAGSYFYVYSTKADVWKLLINLINESTQQSGLESDALRTLITFLKSPLLLFYILLPGSLLLYFTRYKSARSAITRNPLMVFSLLFILFNIPVYIITSKIHNRYLYPLFPFAAILFAGIYHAAAKEESVIKVVSYRTILGLCMLMTVARIGYNIWGIPYQQKTAQQLSFRKLTTEICTLTGYRPVHITGKPDTLLANPVLPFVDLPADTLLIPPFIQPQVPYYCALYTKAVMKYDPAPRTGTFYIVPVSDLPAEQVTVYKYFEGWNHRPFALAVFH